MKSFGQRSIAVKKERKGKGLKRDTRGAVLAEFAIAFMPVAMMFLFVTQFARFEMCRLATWHAANVAVRACAVINNGDAVNPGGDKSNGPKTDANKAAQQVLKPFIGDGSELQVQDIDRPSQSDPEGTDTIKVNATYTCQVPVGKTLMCGGGSKTWTVTAKMPHQGAQYKL